MTTPRKDTGKAFPRMIDKPLEDSAARLINAFIAIRAHAGKKRGIASTIPCPTCKGNLQYRISKNNGHIMAKCSTRGCTAFMQ